MSTQLTGLIIVISASPDINVDSALPKGFYSLLETIRDTRKTGDGFVTTFNIDQAISRGFDEIEFLNKIHAEVPGVTSVFLARTSGGIADYSYFCSRETDTEIANKLMNELVEDLKSALDDTTNNISWW